MGKLSSEKIDRKRKREYSKNKRSQKWKDLNDIYQQKLTEAKESYYSNIVEDLKTSNVGKWYSKLKRMSSDDRTKSDKVNVVSLSDLSPNDQAEIIADSIAYISNQYEPLKYEEIDANLAKNTKPFPRISQEKICQKIRKKLYSLG